MSWTGARGRRAYAVLAEVLVPALGALLVWAMVRTLVLNMFHVQGAYYLDAGWFANLAFRSDWVLTAPSGHPWAHASYFRHHLALFFVPVNALSYLMPTDHVGYFALWYGAIHVFGFLIGHRIVLDAIAHWPLPRPAASLLAGVAGLLFAFNGVAVAALLYPHPEVLMAFAIVGLLWALARDRHGLAWALGLLALAVRTDGGFHVALFCGAAALGLWADAGFDLRAPRVRRLLAVALGGFLYAGLAYALQAVLFPGGAQFRNIYAGPDWFAHVHWDFVLARIDLHLRERGHLFAGALGCVAAFLATRRWVFLAGVLAGLPWYLVNLAARSDAAGTFFSYYAFPFIVLLMWPLTQPKASAAGRGNALPIVALAALLLSIAASLGPGGNGRAVGLSTSLQVTTAQMERLRTTLDQLVGNLPPERVRFDAAVMSLVAKRAARGTLFLPEQGLNGVDTVVHFERYMDTAQIRAGFAALDGVTRCLLPDSELRLLTRAQEAVRTALARGLTCLPGP